MRAPLLVLTLLASPAAPQDAWPSLHGSGLLTLPDTATLAPRRVLAAFGVDNRDRDPLGLDLLDGSLLLTIGVARATEASEPPLPGSASSLQLLPALLDQGLPPGIDG